MSTNPWLRPAINALVICAIGAAGLRFLRGQQPPAKPPPAHTIFAEQKPIAEPPAAPPAAREPSQPTPPPTAPVPVAVPSEDVPAAVAPAETPAAPTETAAAPVVAAPAVPPPTSLTVTPGDTVPGIIRGVARLDGPAPRRSLIRMDADPKCAAMHADEPPLSETVLVTPDGRLRNVFVYLKSPPPGQTYTPPRTPALLDQVGCAYRPRVLGMMARQPLLIRNSDDTLHNVHAMATRNREFNIGQPNRGMESTRTFSTPEVMVKFKCDVHPWMAAYVGVLDHPFFAVTGEDGAFALPELPPGTYTVVAWHEVFGTQEKTVTSPGTVEFVFGR